MAMMASVGRTLRISAMTLKPSIPGIRMSVITKSGPCDCASAMAALPSVV
jgi:hypothetical protein